VNEIAERFVLPQADVTLQKIDRRFQRAQKMWMPGKHIQMRLLIDPELVRLFTYRHAVTTAQFDTKYDTRREEKM
jgi:hypothetical protein